MLEFSFTHPDSIRMLFPGGNSVTIQSTSASQKRGNQGEKGHRRGKKGHRDGQMVFPFIIMKAIAFLFFSSFSFFLLPAPKDPYQIHIRSAKVL